MVVRRESRDFSLKIFSFFFLRGKNRDSHGGKKGVKGLLPQDLPCHRVLHHPRLELCQLQYIVLVLVSQLEHLSHHLCQVQIVLFSFRNLNEDRHQLVQLVESDNLISVLVEEVEDTSEVVLHLARAEEVEEDQHVRH